MGVDAYNHVSVLRSERCDALGVSVNLRLSAVLL